MMRVLILGSTSPAGQQVVRHFFEAYPEGTAVLYVRNPSKLGQEITSNSAITVISGNLSDATAFESCFSDGQNVNAVISVVGPVLPAPPGTPIADGYKVMIPILAKHGVKRLIALSTASLADPLDHFHLLTWILVTIVRLFASGPYRDVVAIGDVVKSECDKVDIDWTVGRVAILNEKLNYTKIVAGYCGDGKSSIQVSRHAIGKWWIEQIESKEWIRKMPYVSTV